MNELDEFHKHELLDRIHCISEMFTSLVMDHLAAKLMQEQLDAVSASLSKAYQRAGELRFNESDKT